MPSVFPERACDLCGKVFAPKNQVQRFCCAAHREAVRRPLERELYPSGHQKARAALKPQVDSGGSICVRCGKRILPGQAWDLDHGDDPRPGHYFGPAHARCNRGAPMRGKTELVRSREW